MLRALSGLGVCGCCWLASPPWVFHAFGNENDSTNQECLLWPGLSLMAEMAHPPLLLQAITSADDHRLQSSARCGRIQVGIGLFEKITMPH
jgi:hypothetical protein